MHNTQSLDAEEMVRAMVHANEWNLYEHFFAMYVRPVVRRRTASFDRQIWRTISLASFKPGLRIKNMILVIRS